MLTRQVSRAMMHNTLLAPLAGAVTVLATIVLTRRLSLDAYGVYAIVSALTLTILAYGDLGISSGMARFVPEMVERSGRAGLTRLIVTVVAVRALLFGTVGLTLAAAPGPWLGLFDLGGGAGVGASGGLFPGRAALLGYAGLIALLEGVATTFLYVLAARFQPKLVNLVQAAHAAALTGFLLLATSRGMGLGGVLSALAAASLVKLALSAALTLREVRAVPVRPEEDKAAWQGRFLKLSLSAYFEKVVAWLHSPAFVVLVLAATTAKVEVALFALAGEFVVRALSFVLNPTNGVILPAFAVAFARGAEAADRVFRYTIRLLTVLATSALVVLLVVTPDLLPLLYSSRYAAAVPAALVLLLFYFVEYTVYAPANAALLAGERLRAYFAVKGVAAALVLLYPLLRPATLVGWAALMGGVRLATALCLLGAAMASHRIRYPLRSLRIFAAGGIVAAGLLAQSRFLPLPPLFQILVGVAGGGVGMLLALRAVNAFDEEDRALVRSTGLPLAQAVARMM